MEELKRFENDLRNNEELRKKLDDAVKRIAGEGNATSDGEVMVKAAKELGYEISIAALEQAKAEIEQLDSEELKKISGGGGDSDKKDWCVADYSCLFMYHDDHEDKDGHNSYCLTAWHCLTAVMHTEGGTIVESCWKDYKCEFINKNPGFWS